MSDSPPPSPLITPDLRRRLTQRFEEAVRLAAQRPQDFVRVHELLAECLRADPGNILYLDELLANLQRWQPKSGSSWLPSWLGGAKHSSTNANDSRTADQWLRDAPDLLRDGYGDALLLGRLATAAGKCQFDSAELVYWWQAVYIAPNDANSLRGLARCLARCGRFEESLENWRKVAAISPDEESARAIDDLRRGPELESDTPEQSPGEVDPTEVENVMDAAVRLARAGAFAQAEQLLAQAQSAAGGDLRLHHAREDLQLARSAHRVEIARRRALSDQHPGAQSLVAQLEQEHNRLAIDIFHVRSERHPGDASLRLELARRLKVAGNYSGAISRLEEARADERLAAEALLELGECWQHLRQFGKALEFYQQAVELSGRVPDSPQPLVGALYRLGVLAAAMDQPAEARAALSRLVAIDPEYKDARQRLDNLP